MIEKERHITELYNLKHSKDDLKNTGADYENKLLEKMTSNYLPVNDTMKDFLSWVQKLSVCMIESNLVIRNFWNYTVDKYYNKHNN